MYSVLSSQESSLYQHIREGETGKEHDAVAWDAAPLEYTGFPHRPEGDSESEGEAGEDMDTTDLQEVVVCMGKGGVHVRLDDWFL